MPADERPGAGLSVFLVTHGSGEDGDAWSVLAIFSTREAAEQYLHDHNLHRPRWASLGTEIEEWPLDNAFDPADFRHDPTKKGTER